MNGKKKIAIVGAGNAACITAMYLHVYCSEEVELSLYYDPSVPIERVGQGIGVDVAELISTFSDMNWSQEKNYIKATHKDGIMYENWGKKNENIFHSFFPFYAGAMHYVPNLLSKMVVNSGKFEVVEKNVIDLEKEIDADFIFDCRGRHNRNPELYDEVINPLNSVILSKKLGKDSDLLHTRCVATPDGWTFVIPNYDSVSYGYLFNDNITSKEKAERNFIELFDVTPDGYLKFQNYIAKNCFQGERTILNGNKLGFLEPMEANSGSFYHTVAQIVMYHIRGEKSKKEVNDMIRTEMFKIQTFVLWHYQYGSKYDTPFWDYAKSLPFCPDDFFMEMYNKSLTLTSQDVAEFNKNRDVGITYAFQWPLMSFANWSQNI